MIAALLLTGCSASEFSDTVQGLVSAGTEQAGEDAVEQSGEEAKADGGSDNGQSQESVSNESEKNLSASSATGSSSTLIDTTDLFSDRDLEQEADLTDATNFTLTSGEDISITAEGVYVISGTATGSSIIVEAADTDKVQIVLDGVSITNEDSPAIYVKSADKVFVTTTDSENTLKVTGTFTADGEVNTDAVIYSKEDLVLNGVGTLNITSYDNGISCKDDLKVTGGTYNITSEADAIEANDSVRISDGTFSIDTAKDAIHAENEEDNTLGYIYISGGTFNIDSDSDGIQATTVLMIDGGTFDIKAGEGLEATYVQINDGTFNIEASDDGINATQKSTAYDVVIEINSGNITVNMGSGDTDALDANGYIYINGGTVDITAQFAFDFDKGAELNGGTVTVNGEEVTEISNSMMMGGGGFGGGRGGMNGQAPDGSQMPEGGQMPQGGFGGHGGRGGNGGFNGQAPGSQTTEDGQTSGSQTP
ncbi:MAG: carbohydrate-binding domain-containing protein [Butyrivibrio sp.]|nr:carbohydrate-binding domain-containing protein [Butyrivibrio sp.]